MWPFLSHIDSIESKLFFANIHVVMEFQDMFDEVPRLSLVREVIFDIELLLGIAHIRQSSYCMSLTKLPKINKYLEAFLKCNFLRGVTLIGVLLPY